MNNYIPYNVNSIKNNFYPLYSNNQFNNYPFQNTNSSEQKNQNKNGKELYNFYRSNSYNINSINPNPKNKNVSLQEEILSPNIEDNRPSIPVPIYYDDTRYKNFYNFNFNHNKKFYENQKIVQNLKNKNFTNNIHTYQNKKGIFDIKENKNINHNKKMLILDLDETLVHSCFKPMENINNNLPRPDIYLKIKFHSKFHDVFVHKRPFVDEFLEKMSKYYNLIIFTASVQEYADPLLDQLDKNRYIKLRYYRNSCLLDKNGKFVKNLATIYNDLKNVILLDNNPISYSYNKNNGLPIITWHFDKKDRELVKMIPILEFLSTVNDIRNYLPRFIEYDMVNFSKFNILIDEINKESEQNKITKIRPKSSKHISTSNKDVQQIQYNNKEHEKMTNTKENKNIERNKYQTLNKQTIQFNTINNISSKQEKEKENLNTNKSLVIQKSDLRLKNFKNDDINRQRKKDKHIKRKINNLFNKNYKYERVQENHEQKINLDENKNKENKINNFIIVNDKQQNKINDNQNNNQNQNKNQINKSNITNIKNKFYERNYNPFIMNSAAKGENKKISLFSNLNNNIDDRNKNIQINIINNIQQINLFKNEFEVNNNNIKKIDIINYYKNNSQKQQGKKNNSYMLRNEEDKIKKENNIRNLSYSNNDDPNKNKNLNRNLKNEINNSQNYYNQTAQNFYPKNKNLINNNENSGINMNNVNQNIIREFNNNKDNNIIRDKISYSNNFNNNFNNNNRLNMFNNYIYNNNINKEKLFQNNNQINKSQNYIENNYRRRTQSYDDKNYLYRPLNLNRFENSNYNNFYNINNYNNKYTNNIHPIYLQKEYNHNNINYRYDLNNNYIYKGNQQIYY